MLVVHHLGLSQSERIVWLCEALEIPYELKIYKRDSVTRHAPAEFKALHPLGTAPIITDDNVVLAESMAVIDYISAKYGTGNLALTPTDLHFADYLFWLHFANGTLQPVLTRTMVLQRGAVPADNPNVVFAYARRHQALELLNKRLEATAFLAGDRLTIADIVTVFSLTTMRLFSPCDLSPYPHILSYLQRIGEQASYKRAMFKSDPDLDPMLK